MYFSINLYLTMTVYVCLCLSVSVYVSLCLSVSVCVLLCLPVYVCVCIYMPERVFMCLSVSVGVCMWCAINVYGYMQVLVCGFVCVGADVVRVCVLFCVRVCVCVKLTPLKNKEPLFCKVCTEAKRQRKQSMTYLDHGLVQSDGISHKALKIVP
jgi:hypothetical protein